MFHEIRLTIDGLGIILYSPSVTKDIPAGTNFLMESYLVGEQVQPFIQSGTLVGFGTGSPGVFPMRFFHGPVDHRILKESEFVLTLGIVISDEMFCVRDLYDLMYWCEECPRDQKINVSNGTYTVVLCSKTPPSGILGDNQEINVFLEKTARMPDLSEDQIPELLSRYPL